MRLLLLFCFVSFTTPLSAQDFFYKQFEGKLGDKTVRIELIKAPSRDNPLFNLRGNYYSEHSKQTVTLTNGQLDAVGNIYLEEGIYRKDTYHTQQRSFIKTGIWTGIYDAGTQQIEGLWVSANRQQSYEFNLKEDYSNNSIPAEIRFNDLHYEEAKMRFHYPVFKRAAVSEKINQYIQQKLLGNMRQKMLDFMNSYQETQLLGGLADVFESSHIIYIMHNANNLLALESRTRSYTGGAHEEYKSVFVNFDLRDGDVLEMKDLFLPGYEQELKQIAARTLRKMYSIRTDQSLAEFGFSFPDQQFYLTENFYLKREGIGFFYNIYEIAPYAVGTQDIFIPFQKIKHLIKKKGLLGKYVKDIE